MIKHVQTVGKPALYVARDGFDREQHRDGERRRAINFAAGSIQPEGRCRLAQGRAYAIDRPQRFAIASWSLLLPWLASRRRQASEIGQILGGPEHATSFDNKDTTMNTSTFLKIEDLANVTGGADAPAAQPSTQAQDMLKHGGTVTNGIWSPGPKSSGGIAVR